MEPTHVALGIIAAIGVPNIYANILPTVSDVYISDEGDYNAYAVLRRGEIHATVLSLTLGVATSVVAKSPIPLIAVVFMVGYMLYLYENAINQ